MLLVLRTLVAAVRALFRRRASLVLENLALRQQLAVLYHESRVHSALDGNSPIPREIESPEKGSVTALPVLGGLHHRYRRAA